MKSYNLKTHIHNSPLLTTCFAVILIQAPGLFLTEFLPRLLATPLSPLQRILTPAAGASLSLLSQSPPLLLSKPCSGSLFPSESKPMSSQLVALYPPSPISGHSPTFSLHPSHTHLLATPWTLQGHPFPGTFTLIISSAWNVSQPLL